MAPTEQTRAVGDALSESVAMEGSEVGELSEEELESTSSQGKHFSSDVYPALLAKARQILQLNEEFLVEPETSNESLASGVKKVFPSASSKPVTVPYPLAFDGVWKVE